MPNKLTLTEFINKANLLHNNFYDYSKVVYINSSTKVCIICPIHGEFLQKPNDHLSMHGCPLCGLSKNKSKLSLGLYKFIEKANMIHNNFYDYSKVIYINNATNICIICPIHGEFYQRPMHHLNGSGCPKCVNVARKNTNIFIKESQLIYFDKYDYSEVEYKNAYTKVCIICHEHGKFYQRPKDHLNGHGCPICKSSKGELVIERILKLNNIKFEFQKRFKDCKNKRSLPFDFYLPDFNMCIEFDGGQHYKPVDFSRGNLTKDQILQKFEKLQMHDKIKNKYCNDNNINLIRITEKENILNKLKEIIGV